MLLQTESAVMTEQANAEAAVRQMLIDFSEEQKLPEVGTVVAEDQMDDGTPIRVGSSGQHSSTSFQLHSQLVILPFAKAMVRACACPQLAVTIDRRDGSATFDFAGTGPEVYGNTNAPPAVTYSAIIYSLRCMVHQDIPLNQVTPRCPARLPPSCVSAHLAAS